MNPKKIFTRKKIIIIFAFLFALLFIGGIYWMHASNTAHQTPVPIAAVSYSCDGGKTINATYYTGAKEPVPSPGQPPIPTGSVALTLSDGRAMTLPQTISADGTRYANADESIVFWSKGNGLMFTENNKEIYAGCIEVMNDPGGLPEVYENGTKGFSLRYPAGFTVDEKYIYQELGPGKDISGIKFTIPMTLAAGTNLSSESYLSVEEIPKTQSCGANLFLDEEGMVKPPIAKEITEGNTTYSEAVLNGAAAGNRYDETVYAIPGTNPCVAVRYFIHYGVFENWSPGTIKRFDEPALVNQFDQIRRTLIVNQ